MNSFLVPPSQLEPRFWLEELYRTDPQVPELRETHRTFSYASGEAIWTEPNHIWVVCSGVVQLSMLHPSGDEVLLGLVVPSMPFGAPLTNLQSGTTKALTSVELLRFSLQEIEQSPNLTLALFRQLNRRLLQTESILAISSHRRIEDRLRHLLLLLKQEVGEPTRDGHEVRLQVKLTHQQLANTIGTSRVTITRLLGQLRAENFVYQDRDRHLVITTSATFA
jgi:CRP-like cAMP-binding protein